MNWSKKIVLLTGGTGSFGQAFTEIILKKYKPKVLRIFSRDELKQSEMMKKFSDYPNIRFLIGDVRDRERVRRAMDGVDIVVHAAALKQVPFCEYNPFEAVRTNVLGAENIVAEAIDHNVERVMGISSDKGVEPLNLYGATKLCMEKVFIAGNSYIGPNRKTKISCVRYGNVLGSRGSVVPSFKEEMSKGILTITDERMTRFWITLEEGVEFVIRCIEMAHGGEVFVPKLASLKIIDLAKAISPGCKIKFIGIRPGEKLHEALITRDESRHTVEFDKFFVIEPQQPWWPYIKWEGGKPLPEGFRYASDTNNKWLTLKELKEMVK